MINGCNPDFDGKVALRKESVDRNKQLIDKCCKFSVALRKESVDRNMRFLPILTGFTGRSPQGERG